MKKSKTSNKENLINHAYIKVYKKRYSHIFLNNNFYDNLKIPAN